MKKHWAVVLPLLWVGCTPDNPNPGPTDSGTQQPGDSGTPEAPLEGTVSGQVLNTRMEPLAGATVKLTLGSATAARPFSTQTDAEGTFLLTGVPAGSQVLVTATKEGHATLRAAATVPGFANGNANVGVLALTETQSSLRLTLLTASGQPAAGAQAYLEASPAGLLAFNGGAITPTGSVVASPVKADASGVVTFPRLPSPVELARLGGPAGSATEGGYRLWVDPVDVNGDGFADAAGASLLLRAQSMVASGGVQTLRLSAPYSEGGTTPAFSLAYTNVPSLQYVSLAEGDPLKAQTELLKKPVRNLVRPGDPVYLGFNHRVVRGSLLAILTDEFGRESLPLTLTEGATGEGYTLQPPAGVLTPGREYNLHVRATSAASGVVKTWKGYFIPGEARAPQSLQLATVTFRDNAGGKAGVLEPGECVYVTFNQSLSQSTSAIDVWLSPNADGTGGRAFRPLKAAPPMDISTCFPSDYPLKYPVDPAFNDATSRFYFNYGGTSSSFPTITPGTGRVRVDFTRLQAEDPNNYFETAWGEPVPPATVLEGPVTAP